MHTTIVMMSDPERDTALRLQFEALGATVQRSPCSDDQESNIIPMGSQHEAGRQ